MITTCWIGLCGCMRFHPSSRPPRCSLAFGLGCGTRGCRGRARTPVPPLMTYAEQEILHITSSLARRPQALRSNTFDRIDGEAKTRLEPDTLLPNRCTTHQIDRREMQWEN